MGHAYHSLWKQEQEPLQVKWRDKEAKVKRGKLSETQRYSFLRPRFYTRFFGNHGNAGPALCCHALTHYPEWETKIEAWQRPILEDE